jgi:hypothetical protein
VDRGRRFALVIPLVLVALGLTSCEGVPTEIISGTETLGTHTIPEGAQMVFDPNVSSTLIMTGSLVVEGTLRMRPANPGVVHRIVFSTADESAFHGSTPAPDNPCAPLTPACYESDEGLWVVSGGRLDISGAVKEPWGHATGALAAGATSLTLDRPATGWSVNDEIAIAPTAPSDYTREIRTITSVSGNEVTFSELAREHPSVTLPDGTVTTAEVLNLTRNVDIEGEPPATPFPRDVQPPPPPNNNGHGRSHIFIQNNTPVQQKIDYTAIRYMGPRQVNTRASSDFVLGRYGLHFHMSGENNRGTVVTGTVVRDAGSHAYVPHMSNGVTFHRTIALDTVETAYWWDVKANEEANLNNDPTDDIRYEETVAGGISVDFRGSIRPAGYTAACGARNQIVGAVAFGVQAAVQSTGIVWPEGANGCSNNWAVGSTIVHNNNGAGLFTWQNDTEKHGLINGVVAYRNGGPCLDHGAYRNRFDYSNIECFDNRGKWDPGTHSVERTEVLLRAHSEGSNPSQLNDFVIRGGAEIEDALRIFHDRADTPATATTTLRRWDVGGYTGHAVRITEDSGMSAGQFDFVCWTLPEGRPEGRELTPADFLIDGMNPASVYQVQTSVPGGAYRLTFDGTGPIATPIADFAAC